MYKIIRTILFFFDAEKVHHFSMNALKLLCRVGFIKGVIKSIFAPKNCGIWHLEWNLKTTELGIRNLDLGSANQLTPNSQSPLLRLPFKNPVGLAAGFDKNAKYLNELEALGFGFVEIGTVTPVAQVGNPSPRLFRLPKDKALINRMGFNNDGVQVVVERLKNWQKKNYKLKITNYENQHSFSNLPNNELTNHLIIGGNIGKNKNTPNENAWQDYELCFTALHPYVDYFVVNVSSPNTPGLRELQEKEPLKKILTHLQNLNYSYSNPKPILLKIAPDLTLSQIDDVIDLAKEIQLDGLVVANTTIDLSKLSTNLHQLSTIGAGGLSGLPLKDKATELVNYINKKTNGTIPIIASGGIFTGQDAQEKLAVGAALVQVWTGFVYEGPAIVKKITTYLAGVRG